MRKRRESGKVRSLDWDARLILSDVDKKQTNKKIWLDASLGSSANYKRSGKTIEDYAHRISNLRNLVSLRKVSSNLATTNHWLGAVSEEYCLSTNGEVYLKA